jgi:AcrR family transcriptional regulator
MSQHDRHQAGGAAATLCRPLPPPGAGVTARDRELGARGRDTVGRLLAAAMVEFGLHGSSRVRVDDVVRRAKLSHGTFYSYFLKKEDLFRALLDNAIQHMQIVVAGFPVVTRDAAGRQALRRWVAEYGDAYAMHARVIRSHGWASMTGAESLRSSDVRLLFEFTECIAKGMTAAARKASAAGEAGCARDTGQCEPAALACLMMLERANDLFSISALPRTDMEERITDVMLAAFSA